MTKNNSLPFPNYSHEKNEKRHYTYHLSISHYSHTPLGVGMGEREWECDQKKRKEPTMKPQIKARPVITLADLVKAAFPRVTNEPIHVSKLLNGQPHSYKLRGQVQGDVYVAVVCPSCGDPTGNLYSHPERPGLMCVTCLDLYSEPIATETGPNQIKAIREGE